MIQRLLLPALLLLSACGQSGEPDIQLGNAWARPTRGEAPGAVYVAINNKGSADDRLVGAFTDHAAMAMVHQSELVDGVAQMRMAGEINIPAGKRIERVRFDNRQNLAKDRTYTLVVSDFMATGGSGFGMLTSAPREDLDVIDVDALIRYLSVLHQPVEAPAEPRFHAAGH